MAQHSERQRDDLLKTTLSLLVESSSKNKTKKLADTIEDNFLVCRICEETFKNPKCLTCLHSFCEQCLEKHVSQSENPRYKKFTSCEYRDITCPLCRKKTPLPMGGVKKLPDNFIVNGLTDVIIKQKPAELIQCDFCKASKGPSSGTARLKCMECNKNLCRDCASFHKETRVTKHHSLFDLNFEKEIQCFDHVDEVVRFYCETCEKCVCVVCTFEAHQAHEVTSFEDAFAKFSQPIKILAKKCEEKLLVSEETLEKLERCENLIRCVEQCVKDKVVEVMSDLKIRETQLLEEVRNIYGADLFKKISHKKEFILQIENMKNSKKLTEVVLDGKNIEFLLLKKTIESKLSLIASLDEKPYHLPSSVDKLIEFRPSSFSFGYIYDYDDPDPNKEKSSKKGNSEKNVNSKSFGTSTADLNSIEKKNKICEIVKKEIVHEPIESSLVKKLSQNLKSIESQTEPLSLDFLIAAYKCERKYSPAKDLFYNTSDIVGKQITQLVPPTTKAFSQSPLKPPLPPPTKKTKKFTLPEIPSFESLGVSKGIKKNFEDVLKEKDRKNNDENKNIPAFNDVEKNKKSPKVDQKNVKNDLNLGNFVKESIAKDAAIILKLPFTKLSKVVVSPPPTIIYSNKNELHDQEGHTIGSTQNLTPKVIATVAPTICSVAKSNCQPVPTFTQASIPSHSVSSLSKEAQQDLTQNSAKTKVGNISRNLATSKQNKISESFLSSKLSNNEEGGLRRKLRDRDLTHLSDSPLFRKSKLYTSITSMNSPLRDHKSPGNHSTNPALQLYYQTIGSRKSSPYVPPSSKLDFKSLYSSHSNQASNGYKYNSYKFH